MALRQVAYRRLLPHRLERDLRLQRRINLPSCLHHLPLRPVPLGADFFQLSHWSQMPGPLQWATRALIEHVIGKTALCSMSCQEPGCGAGHTARGLREYFGEVRCADAFSYGYAPVRDFLTYPYETNSVDWVITNAPFRLAQEFVLRALRVARRGVAILVRTVP